MSDDAAETGLTVLLADGVAEAMGAAEATLATVQSAALRAFAGLTQVQAVGAAAASVPPPEPSSIVAASEIADVPRTQVPPVGRFAPSPAVWPGAPGQVAFAPVSGPGGDAMTEPAPVALRVAPAALAAFAPLPVPAVMPDATTSQPISGDVAPSVFRDRPPASAPDAMVLRAPVASGSGSQQALRPHAPTAAHVVQSGPTGGDVFLDGTRVGTWLADHMAREVGRPQASSTGFDPRLTPAWPGTLQGG